MNNAIPDSIRSEDLDRAVGEKLVRIKEKTPPSHYNELPRVPVGRFIEDDFYRAEQKHLWPNVWVYAAHIDELPNSGSFVRFDHLGAPIVVIRGSDDVIRAFYNTCPHRGAPVLLEKSGTQSGLIVCPFHAWSFDSTGALQAVPMQQEFGCFNRADHKLRQIRCETIGNLVYVNRNDAAPPLRTALGEQFSDDFMKFAFLDKAKLLHKSTVELNANWKNVVQAFIEVYHLPMVHRKSLPSLLGTSNIVNVNMIYPNGGTGMYTMAPTPGSVDKGAGTDFSDWKLIRNHNSFPNFLTSLQGKDFWIAIIPWPISTGRTRIESIFFYNPDGALRDEAARHHVLKSVETIVSEDLILLSESFSAMSTGALDGLLVGNEESNIYHFEQEVDRCIGAENIPDRLRISPRSQPAVS